jgi:hypothetical protein
VVVPTLECAERSDRFVVCSPSESLAQPWDSSDGLGRAHCRGDTASNGTRARCAVRKRAAAGAVEEFRRRQRYHWPGLILLCAGFTYVSAGRIEAAAAHAREALALTRQLGARGSEAHALCLTGDVASTGSAEEAERYDREALALANELDMRPLVAHCHALGKLRRLTGNRGQAQEHLTIATAMYREMDMAYWLEQAAAEIQQLG